MDEQTLMRAAQERAVKHGLPYTGALTPKEAHAYAQIADGAAIVDVRTEAELNYVGRIPDALAVQWQTWPDMEINANFAQQLKQAGLNEDRPVLFICRSGVRSHHAAVAMAELGYKRVFNIIEGFEGDPDENGHRNTVNGWRFSGLPWTQS